LVHRNVNRLGTRRLDYDGLLLDDHALLFGRLETAGLLGLAPQPLDRIEHGRLLVRYRITELLHPVQVLVQHRNDLRERHQRFDARVPAFLFQSFDQFTALQLLVAVILKPTRHRDDLQRVGRCHQYLGQQLVRVERDWSEHRVKLLDIEFAGDRRSGGRQRWLRNELWRWQSQSNRRHDHDAANEMFQHATIFMHGKS
jgi:hypothetical protein